MKISPIMSQIYQSMVSILPNKKLTITNLLNTHKLLPKWWNFAKSCHTVCSRWLESSQANKFYRQQRPRWRVSKRVPKKWNLDRSGFCLSQEFPLMVIRIRIRMLSRTTPIPISSLQMFFLSPPPAKDRGRKIKEKFKSKTCCCFTVARKQRRNF